MMKLFCSSELVDEIQHFSGEKKDDALLFQSEGPNLHQITLFQPSFQHKISTQDFNPFQPRRQMSAN